MIDRITEVLAVYGAIMAIALTYARFGENAHTLYASFVNSALGWTGIYFCAGALYIIFGIYP
jgi:hypothetical protein